MIPTARPKWTVNRVRELLLRRFAVRVHMTLILASTAMSAMLVNWALRHLGVDAMWLRYPVAVLASYAVFLGGIRLWIAYVDIGDDDESPDGNRGTRGLFGGKGRDRDTSGSFDFGGGGGSGGGSTSASSGGFGGSGGRFGGGGASGNWEGGNNASAFTSDLRAPIDTGGGSAGSSSGESSSGSGFRLPGGSGSGGGGGGGDGDLVTLIVLIVLTLLVLTSILLLSGYVIWVAPDILSEAAFGAMLSGGLARAARRNQEDGWVGGVIRRTWWPFAIVLVLATGLGVFVAANLPGAHTLGEAFRMALS